MRPNTCMTQKPHKMLQMAYHSNMAEVIKTNPLQFFPKKPSKINFNSTNYNFVNFSPTKKTEEVINVRKSSNYERTKTAD